ncbi:MAG: hypothetical protein OEL83_01665 [Desulforhopalus sp.]|nr:hypothetical protein [Desulforhopalus sp.]
MTIKSLRPQVLSWVFEATTVGVAGYFLQIYFFWLNLSLKGALAGKHVVYVEGFIRKILNLSILGVTAHAMQEDQQRSLAVRLNDYLSRPCKIEGIATTL